MEGTTRTRIFSRIKHKQYKKMKDQELKDQDLTLGGGDSLEELSTGLPTTPLPKGPRIKDKAKDWQKAADQVVEDALIAVPDTIGGVDLHPFSTARGSLLRRIGNEFVAGVQLDEIEDPFLSVGKFLVMMSADLAEARSLCKKESEDALEKRAYDILESVHMSEIPDVVAAVNVYVHREMENRVHGEAHSPDGGDSAPEGPKN